MKKFEAPLMEENEINLLEAIFKTPKMSKLHFFVLRLQKHFVEEKKNSKIPSAFQHVVMDKAVACRGNNASVLGSIPTASK